MPVGPLHDQVLLASDTIATLPIPVHTADEVWLRKNLSCVKKRMVSKVHENLLVS